jgi:hypothetical protein
MDTHTPWRVAATWIGLTLWIASQAGLADQPPAADRERIATLIRDLDANEYSAREAASAELLKLGEPAVPAIKAALRNSPSAEVRARADRLVREIIVWGDSPHELSLPQILEQAKQAAQAKDPAKAGDDGKLEKLLDCWAQVLGQASGQTGIRPPVRFADVKFARYEQRGEEGGAWRDSLLILHRARLKSAVRCVILADELVEIDHAEDCIILTRAAAKLDHCGNSVVIAGQLIQATGAYGSILIAGSVVDLSNASDSVVAGADDVSAQFVSNVSAVNSRVDQNALQNGIRRVRLPELHFAKGEPKNPLAERVRLIETLWEGDPVARVRVKGAADQIVKYGKAIVGPDAHSVAELKGWTLCFANRGVAVFTDGDDSATLRAKR